MSKITERIEHRKARAAMNRWRDAERERIEGWMAREAAAEAAKPKPRVPDWMLHVLLVVAMIAAMVGLYFYLKVTTGAQP